MNTAKIWTIYCHTHTETGRRYIGLTQKRMIQRWNQHCSQARAIKFSRNHWYNALRKYGKEAFSHEILEKCHSLEVANIAEESWIEFYETRDPERGFNLSRGGRHTPHPESDIWSRPGFREKMSAAQKLRYSDPEEILKKKIISREVCSRPELRQKWSEATSRQFSSRESRENMAQIIKELRKNPEMNARFNSGIKAHDKIRAARTHCKNKHEFSTENTRIDGKGYRHCRKCDCEKSSRLSFKNRTHCYQGHEFSNDNFRLSTDGRRICLACRKTHCKRGHEFVPGNFIVRETSRICIICRRNRNKTECPIL